MRDPWVCRCGHEFAFVGLGTPHCREVPHDCPLDRPEAERNDRHVTTTAPDGRTFRTVAFAPDRPLTDAERERLEADIVGAQARFLAHYFPAEAD